MDKTTLFLKEYEFRGKQNEMATALTDVIDKNSNTKIFSSLVDLFLTSALIGCYYDLKADVDKGPGGKKIFPGEFNSRSAIINLEFRLVLLCSGGDKYTSKEKIDRALRNRETSENYELFEQHMLGGLEFLYNKFILDTNVRFDHYLTIANNMISEFKDNYSENSSDDIDTTNLF